MKSTMQTCSLEQAVVNGDIDALKKFLKSGENINVLDINGEPLLFIPIVNGDMDTLKFCLMHSEVNMTSEDDKTALMIAVEMNDMDMVKKLIKAGARLDCQDMTGKTPLLLALDHGRFSMAEYLIKHGSDVNAVDDLGQSALHFVVASDRKDCIKIVKILFHCGYVMKECDNWLGSEDIIGNKMKESKCLKMLHKMNMSLKTVLGSGSMFQLDS